MKQGSQAMTASAKDIEDAIALSAEIRRSFQSLSRFANGLHGDLGVNASMRAVMEFIDQHGPAPVPEIAAQKNVSRQHIQTIVDQLVQAGLTAQRDNPDHKRSYLIALTPKGAAHFETIRQREGEAFRQLAALLTGANLREAAQTLSAYRAALTNLDT